MKTIVKKLIPPCFISRYHFLLAFLGALFYGFPSYLRRPALRSELCQDKGFGRQAKRLKVIGVTGTKGKSTTVCLISQILEEAGFKTALSSSIKFKVADKEWQNKLKMGMPGRFKLQKLLREAVKAGCSYFVLEVTSEGIRQHRHRFIDFDAAVFTNLAPEHIESHGSFEKYRETKAKLFKLCKKLHILNLDDGNVQYFLTFSAQQKLLFSLNQVRGDSKSAAKDQKVVLGAEVEKRAQGLRFMVEGISFSLNLTGRFNIYNTLAAICVGLSQGVSLETCKKALEKVEKIPGRMEEVFSKPFKVVVDYAHTPDSLTKVYETIRNPKSQIPNSKQIPNSNDQNSKLICVLGACGGGRDKWKRPKMGEIAERYCDEIILTNEDPYDEEPRRILSQIKSGISNLQTPISNFYEILDRREAIRKALTLAKPGDAVIITGKGCEPWMCLAQGKKIPWDDREVVQEEFQKLQNEPTTTFL